MEKNRIRPIKSGKSSRMSYARQKEVVQMPNLIEVQTDSYKWFLDEGLNEVFDDISPITDYSGKLSLDFVDFTLCENEVKYTIDECKERDATYAAPLKVKVRLHNKETDEINEHEIFMGDLPLMTRTGTFVINGAERVIVSQLVRSPGIYYAIAHDKLGKKLYSATVIPNRGAWLEYETDSNDVFYVRVDRTRKVPITVLIRALGIGTNPEIIELFGEEPKILASFEKDAATNYQEGLLELYKKIRPGEPLAVDSAESLITSMFFDPRRYDLAKVGRYKFNKKLALKNRISGQVLAEDVASPMTGEVLAEAGTKITRELASAIQNNAVPYVWISPAGYISSTFGYRTQPIAGASTNHKGIDFAAATGTPIYAATAGTVISAGYAGNAGNLLVINHGNGLLTYYMHCSKIYVSAGQKVSKGQNVAAVGTTGNSTGPHLHFQVMLNGTPVNPANYL